MRPTILNEVGKELLSSLSVNELNEATVCNTWFMEKDTHLQANLAAPQVRAMALHRPCHHEAQRCLDVTMVRRAQCNKCKSKGELGSKWKH